MQKLLKVQEAAELTGLSASTLNKMRGTGHGPRFHRLGKRRVAYSQADVEAWLKERSHASTSEYGTDATRV